MTSYPRVIPGPGFRSIGACFILSFVIANVCPMVWYLKSYKSSQCMPLSGLTNFHPTAKIAPKMHQTLYFWAQKDTFWCIPDAIFAVEWKLVRPLTGFIWFQISNHAANVSSNKAQYKTSSNRAKTRSGYDPGVWRHKMTLWCQIENRLR